MKKSLDIELWRKAGPQLELLDGEQSASESGPIGRRPAPGRQTLWGAQGEPPALVPGLEVPGKRVLSPQPSR